MFIRMKKVYMCIHLQILLHSRVFKKHVGMTSSEYRAKFAKKQ